MSVFEGLVLSVIAALSALTVLWALWHTRYGFDFTDESFYLVWMQDPSPYGASISQFGFLWHPLYDLLGENIVALRVASLLVIALLAWTLSVRVLKVAGLVSAGSTTRSIILGAGLGSASLAVFGGSISTPGYNALNFIGFLIVAIGVTCARKDHSPVSVAGWVLFAIGGWLAFMAKPTAALALAVSLAAYLVWSKRFSIRLATLSAILTIGMVITAAVVISGSISGFVERLSEGSKLLTLLDPSYSIGTLMEHFVRGALRPAVPLPTLTIVAVIFAAALVAILLLHAQRNRANNVGKLLTLVLAVGAFGVLAGSAWLAVQLGTASFLLVAPALAATVAGLILLVWGNMWSGWRRSLPLVVLLAVLPFAYTFGTNNSTWPASSKVGLFWILGGVLLLGSVVDVKNSWVTLTPVVLATILGTAVILQAGFTAPYRQPGPLLANSRTVAVGPLGSQLVLADSSADYIESLRTTAKAGGFESRTPMIDLTGASPGALFVLDARSMGQPWLLGAYEGSDAFAISSLRKESCSDIARSWLLVEPDGPRALSTEVLTSFGATQTEHYEEVGIVRTPDGSEQSLLKPVRPEAEAVRACEGSEASVQGD